jgi:hypothetical protein
MRFSLFALLALVILSGCDGKPLTGPDAQRAVAQAKSAHLSFDSGPVILVDGVRVTSEEALQKLDPKMIESVEILKRGVAAHSYGPERTTGLIIIKTKRLAAPNPPR